MLEEERRGADPEPLGEDISISYERFALALRKKSFDLDRYQFMTTDSKGNRFAAAAYPRPSDEKPVADVQVIGPFAKASGLGQAARLSVDSLRTTDLVVRAVDFDLDNPAPEGFSSNIFLEDYGPARVNLIHLNAESIPLAFAYQPDVFSNAYNIGYFFWELDKPALCHYLGMEMLDEIWVSTEYGLQIYKDESKGKPVTNVGMCYEDLGEIDRATARRFIERRFSFSEKHHVCLVAFDSFSFIQRKNPLAALEAFQKAFKDVPNARLIVKTQNRDSVLDPMQVQIWDRVEAIVSADRRIVIFNETLSYRDLLLLKAGSDCYISLHRSEGWGFGMIEAMNLRVPVVCTGYSGNMDFCSEKTAWLVEFEEVLLQQNDYIFVRKGAKWADPNVESAARQLRAVYDDPEDRQRRLEAAYQEIRTNFSVEAIGSRLWRAFAGHLGRAFLMAGVRALSDALYNYHCEFDAFGLMVSFAVPGQTSEPEFIKNFLGVKIPAKVYAPILEAMKGRVEPVPDPGNWHADIAEWAAALLSVVQARTITDCRAWLRLGLLAGQHGGSCACAGSLGGSDRCRGGRQPSGECREVLALNGFAEDQFKLNHGICSAQARQGDLSQSRTGHGGLGGGGHLLPGREDAGRGPQGPVRPGA